MIAFMQFIGTILPYIQIVLAVLLIVAILLQTRGSSVGGAFGGSEMGTTFYTRRGAEKTLFQATIGLAVLFSLSAFLALFV
jgi:preprotein translocase subunit SecG